MDGATETTGLDAQVAVANGEMDAGEVEEKEIAGIRSGKITAPSAGKQEPVAESTETEDVEAAGDEDAETGEQEEQEEPKAPVLDARLKQAAKRAGLSDEEMATIPVSTIQKIADSQDAVSTAFAELGREPDGSVKKEAADGEAEEAEASAFDINKPFELDIDLTDAEGDPVFTDEAHQVFNGQNNAIEGLRAFGVSLMQRFGPALEYFEQQRQRDHDKNVDGFFEKLAEDYGDIYGKGPGAALDREGVEWKNRKNVCEFANAMLQTLRKMGKEKDYLEALEEAHSVHQGKRIKEQAEKAGAEKARAALKKRGKQIQERPGSRAAVPKPKTEEDRIAAIEATAKNLGFVA
jgi:hypothetical protein